MADEVPEVSREEAKRAFYGTSKVPIRDSAEYLEYLAQRVSVLEDIVFDLYKHS